MTNEPVKGYHVSDNEEIIAIPAKVLYMLTWDGYIAMFWELIQERGYNHRQSWEACERTLTHYKLPERYSSYESFKVVRNRTPPGGEDVLTFW